MNNRYTYGTTPAEVITEACKQQCPDGYPMIIRSKQEWSVLASAINQGIDSHLEAITERSTFNSSTGECNVHPEELHVLLRRMDNGDEEGENLRVSILSTLGIEEI